jgi:hypothetical protein
MADERAKAEKAKVDAYRKANPDWDENAPAGGPVNTEAELINQHSGGTWPPQQTELQLQAAAIEGRLTDAGAEKLAEDLQDQGVDVEPEQLQSGEASPVAPADTGVASNDARENTQGAVDRAAGDETEEKKNLEEDEASSGTKPQAKARRAQGAK